MVREEGEMEEAGNKLGRIGPLPHSCTRPEQTLDELSCAKNSSMTAPRPLSRSFSRASPVSAGIGASEYEGLSPGRRRRLLAPFVGRLLAGLPPQHPRPMALFFPTTNKSKTKICDRRSPHLA